MQCLNPMEGWRGRSGGVVFNLKDGYQDQPVSFRCGRCSPCRVYATSMWSVRCLHEASCHEENIFLTLTYDDEHLPYGETLVPDHLSQIFKKLRDRGNKLRYYACGEYGDTTKRPHYHALVFGYRPADAKFHSQHDDKRNYTSETLDEIWGLGFAQFSDVTYASAAYTCGYTRKKIYGDLAETHYQHVDPETGLITQKVPEFSRQSNRPGIGESWFRKYGPDVLVKDEIVIQGKPAPLPRYYEKLAEKLFPDLLLKTRKLRAQKNHQPIYRYVDENGQTIQHGYYRYNAAVDKKPDRHALQYKGSSRQLLTGEIIRQKKSAHIRRDVS